MWDSTDIGSILHFCTDIKVQFHIHYWHYTSVAQNTYLKKFLLNLLYVSYFVVIANARKTAQPWYYENKLIYMFIKQINLSNGIIILSHEAFDLEICFNVSSAHQGWIYLIIYSKNIDIITI